MLISRPLMLGLRNSIRSQDILEINNPIKQTRTDQICHVNFILELTLLLLILRKRSKISAYQFTLI